MVTKMGSSQVMRKNLNVPYQIKFVPQPLNHFKAVQIVAKIMEKLTIIRKEVPKNN